MSTATVPRATGYPVPASGAALNSEPVRTQLVNIVDFLEGGNIAQGNIDVTEVAALAVANTWTANQTYSATLTVGADDTGYDVQFFGATSGKSLLWDESADTLIVTGAQTISETLGVTGAATFTAQSVHTGGIQSGGNIVSDTDSTDDLGTTGVRWANLYVDDITLTTTITAGTSVVANTMTLSTGSIVDSTGAISFGDENLLTTGTLGAGATTVTSLLASSDDVGAIGASGTGFSDLFLASGAVIDFNAGDMVITHSANDLAITGGNLTISENAVVLTLNDTSATGNPALDFQQAGVQRGFIQYQDTGDILEFQAIGGFKFSDYAGSTPLVGVGKTAVVPFDLQVDYGSSNLVRLDNSTATNPSVLALITSGASPDNNTQTFLTCDDSTTTRLIIYSDGDVVNHDNSYGAISDESLKENIVDATPKLDDVMSVQIRNFNFIGEEHKQIGVIAQELQNVFPALTEENGDGLLSVKYSVFVPILIKAFQEFVGQTNSRLEALEV